MNFPSRFTCPYPPLHFIPWKFQQPLPSTKTLSRNFLLRLSGFIFPPIGIEAILSLLTVTGKPRLYLPPFRGPRASSHLALLRFRIVVAPSLSGLDQDCPVGRSLSSRGF